MNDRCLIPMVLYPFCIYLLQVMGLGADMRQQDARVESLSQQLAESQRVNAELRGQVCGAGCVGRCERRVRALCKPGAGEEAYAYCRILLHCAADLLE